MTEARSAAGAHRHRRAKLTGIGWMLLTGVLFVGVTGIVRHLGSDMSPVQAAFIRYVFGLILIAPVFFKLDLAALSRRSLGLHAVRGLAHGIAVMLWFFAMARIPIAEVTAIGFTAPIFTSLGAALFLGERLHSRRIGAILIGFGGTMVILRPGFQEIEPGALAQLTAAPLFAISFLIAKKLTATQSSASIVAFLSIFVTLALLPPALMVWRTPTPQELGWLLATATLATLGHYTLTRAFQAAPITVTQPFSFLQLVWATLLGFYAFSEEPDLWTWVGAGIIVGSATYIAHREILRRGQADPKPGPH
jgi:drug/metabolite transporter (DMT)-like permease